MHTTTDASIAAGADQIESTIMHVRRLTDRNRLLADPQVGDPYISECLAQNLHGQWSRIDDDLFDQWTTGPGSVPRIVRADHAEGEEGWPPPAEASILVDDTRPISRPGWDICYRCLDPLRRAPARKQECRALWIGKGAYIAEFHFCLANCAPYIERTFPTVEWKDNQHAL